MTEVWAMTLLVVMRRRVGERYFTWGMFANGLLLLLLSPLFGYVLFVALTPLIPDAFVSVLENADQWFGPFVAWGLFPHLAFLLLYSILGIRHRRGIAARTKIGEHDYTFSIGEPDPAILGRIPGYAKFTTPRDLERFFEPAVSAGTGCVLLLCANWFGFYLLLGGICLFLTARRDFREHEEICNDGRDGQIIASHLTDVLKPVEEASRLIAHTVRLPERASGGDYPSVENAYDALAPELGQLLTPLKTRNADPESGNEPRMPH